MDATGAGQKNRQGECKEHQTALNYYCKTCTIPICSDCAMFGTKHKGHEFERLQDVYVRHVELIKHEAVGLKKRLKDLGYFMRDVQVTIDKV